MIISQQEIAAELKKNNFSWSGNAVNAAVSSFRQSFLRLESDYWLKTIRGKGYCFTIETQRDAPDAEEDDDASEMEAEVVEAIAEVEEQAPEEEPVAETEEEMEEAEETEEIPSSETSEYKVKPSSICLPTTTLVKAIATLSPRLAF